MKTKTKKVKNNYFPLILEPGMVITFLGNKHPPGSIDLPGVNRAARRLDAKRKRRPKKIIEKAPVKTVTDTPPVIPTLLRVPARLPWYKRILQSIIKFLRIEQWKKIINKKK